MNKIELLAPAGSLECVDAALLGGADAIYMGGTLFNARIFAKNLDNDALKRAVDRCHKQGVSVYVTVNTQLYDRELPEALSYLAYLYEIGVDALICADLGLAHLAKRYFPDFPLHASTQLSGHNTDCARRLAQFGFSRMVCAREMSKADIETLCKNSPIEIEQFVHGALCASHSGQCLMSAMIGGRSGNRGACAQPCRMQYQKDGFALSLKDLCLAGHITEILQSGVASLKIEGRMKSPDYVYGVTSLYRRLIDEERNATPKEIEQLARLFCRGGFTDGYYTHKIDASMLGVRSEQDKNETRKVRVQLAPVLRKNPLPYTAPNRARATRDFEKIPKCTVPPKRVQSARFASASQIPAAHGLDIVYLPLFAKSLDGANGVVLPPVIYDRDRENVLCALKKAKSKGIRHALCGNLGHVDLVKEAELILHADFRCNICNSVSASVWESLGAQDFLLSPELILPQMRDIGLQKSAIVYGRLPLMLLEKRVGKQVLRDRTDAAFPIFDEGGRDVLYNSVPIYMADQDALLQSANLRNRHYIFTTESRAQVEKLLFSYAKGEKATFPHRRIAQKPQPIKKKFAKTY